MASALTKRRRTARHAEGLFNGDENGDEPP